MNAVLEEIKRGQHPHMLETIEFSFDERRVNGQLIMENSISPTHYSPSRVVYNAQGVQIHDGWICTQAFWNYETKDAFEKHYMRMVRCGKSNYLNFWQLSEDMNLSLDDIEYYCAICDNPFKGSGYNCVGKTCRHSDDTEVCLPCYETHTHCEVCNSPLQPI